MPCNAANVTSTVPTHLFVGKFLNLYTRKTISRNGPEHRRGNTRPDEKWNGIICKWQTIANARNVFIFSKHGLYDFCNHIGNMPNFAAAMSLHLPQKTNYTQSGQTLQRKEYSRRRILDPNSGLHALEPFLRSNWTMFHGVWDYSIQHALVPSWWSNNSLVGCGLRIIHVSFSGTFYLLVDAGVCSVRVWLVVRLINSNL